MMPPTGERIRVMRIIARLNIGGPALHATLLTDRLDPDRYESVLVTGVEQAGEGNYLALHGRRSARIVVVPALGRALDLRRDVATLLELARLIRRVRPHIVHTHTAKAGAVGRLAAWLARVPVIVHTYHGHVLDGYFTAWKTRIFVAIERWLAKRSHCVLAVSENVRRELLARGIGTAEQLRVIPLGLELERFAAADSLRGHLRRELDVKPDTPLVGIVARLVPIKAHETFVAVAAILTRRTDCHFVVVGDGERRSELEQLATRAGVDGRIHFLGWRADLERIYADLDVVVLTSRNEGSPVALIEAMAAGKPVVATSVGGVPDVVEHGVSGILVRAGDVEALASAVEGVIRDPTRGRLMGEAGRRRVRGVYGADRLLRNMDDLYQELLVAAV
jgi:glycosyltransferase involved in cell wall biosynthesis